MKVRGVLGAVVAGLAILPATSASAALYQSGAIGVGTDGTTYVGGNGFIQKVKADGTNLGSLTVAAGSIAALSVDPSDNVWVVDGSDTVKQFKGSDGTLLRSWSPGPCTRPADGWKGGGIDAGDQYLFVALTCRDEVARVDIADFGNKRTVAVEHPDGLDFNKWASCGYKLAVAQPLQGRTSLYDENLNPTGTRSTGDTTDVFVDDYGVLMATDQNTDQIHMLGCDGVEFRTLGRTGSNLGDLDHAMAFDVFGQYGGDLAGNLFIAEYSNSRVQRWSSGGYTFWASATTTDAPGGGGGNPGGGGDPGGGGNPGGGGTDPSNPGNAPVGVSIEAAAAYVNNPNVIITIHEPAGTTGVRIANDGGFVTSTTLAPSADDRYTWTLPVSGLSERLPRTVYVRFVGSGDDTKTFTDDIILDTTPPGVQSVTVSQAAASTRSAFAAVAKKPKPVTLKVRAKDAVSGVARVQIAATRGGRRSLTRTYAPTIKVAGFGARPWIRVIDRAGNYSTWKRARWR